jgi:hypothetical protein
LQLHRQIADFIQEQRAAVGCLDTPDLALMGAGKGALFVAEQLDWIKCSGIAPQLIATNGLAWRWD